MKIFFTFWVLSSLTFLTPTPAFAGASVLFDNGPIITQLGTGLGGTNESVLENNTLSMISFGSAHQAVDDLRVADDFVVPQGGWQLNSIDLFAYQTNEPASTISAINLRIWDGPPAAPGSNLIFGDLTTNRLTTTNNSGIVRVNEDTQGIDDSRQVAISSVTIDILLTAGTYWIDWQSSGSNSTGIFVPHVTIQGQDTTGNALLSTDNGVNFTAISDAGTLTPQGLPFIMRGSLGTLNQVPSTNWYALLLLVLAITIVTIKYNNPRTKY